MALGPGPGRSSLAAGLSSQHRGPCPVTRACPHPALRTCRRLPTRHPLQPLPRMAAVVVEVAVPRMVVAEAVEARTIDGWKY